MAEATAIPHFVVYSWLSY